MKVKLELYKYGGISCLDEGCIFKRECANHMTAGDFRSEDGFTPQLEEKNGEYFCATKDAEIDEWYSCEYGTTYPEGREKLGDGAMTQKDLKLVSVINYVI